MNGNEKILIVGIGNAYRRDDAVGLMIARRLREKAINNVTVIEQDGDGGSLMEQWRDADLVFLIDAVASGSQPGTIYRFEAHAQPIPTKFFNYSTHAFSIAETIEMARTLNQLPSKLVVYGIEGENFAPGTGLSEKVEQAVKEVAQRVAREVERIAHA